MKVVSLVQHLRRTRRYRVTVLTSSILGVVMRKVDPRYRATVLTSSILGVVMRKVDPTLPRGGSDVVEIQLKLS